jgi:hypothetical protein
VTGVVAGAVGGTIRALLIADTLASIVARYAAVPGWFIGVVLAVFVALATLVSAGAGAALAFAGVRLSRLRARSGSSATSESRDRAKRGGEAQAAEAGRAERDN